LTKNIKDKLINIDIESNKSSLDELDQQRTGNILVELI
jgi:hypothetical protein